MDLVRTLSSFVLLLFFAQEASTSQWTVDTIIQEPNPGPNRNFGYHVAYGGNRIFASALNSKVLHLYNAANAATKWGEETTV